MVSRSKLLWCDLPFVKASFMAVPLRLRGPIPLGLKGQKIVCPV